MFVVCSHEPILEYIFVQCFSMLFFERRQRLTRTRMVCAPGQFSVVLKKKKKKKEEEEKKKEKKKREKVGVPDS